MGGLRKEIRCKVFGKVDAFWVHQGGTGQNGRHAHASGGRGVLEDMGSGQTRDGGGGVVGNPCHVESMP